ncbi:hypothetical protein [Cochleicola gelatinilyticus]|nr:hypothetical protein [Cochleicola gelatinilyticus]
MSSLLNTKNELIDILSENKEGHTVISKVVKKERYRDHQYLIEMTVTKIK